MRRPTDEEWAALSVALGRWDDNQSDVRELYEVWAPIIAHIRRDATVAWLERNARELAGANDSFLGETSRALLATAARLKRDEDLLP